MRVILRAHVLLGAVTVPVGLATSAKRADPEFRELHRECETPITRRRWCPHHEAFVEDEADIVRGWEVAPGEYVLADDLPTPDESRTLTVLRCVPAREIPLRAIDRTHLLVPAADPVGKRPYALLARALRRRRAAAVVRYVAWDRERLGAVCADGRTLVLRELYHADDVRDATPIGDLLAGVRLTRQELELADELVDQIAGPWEHDAWPNLHRDLLRQALEGKLADGVLARPAATTAPAPTADLATALEQSLKQTRRRRRSRA